MKAKKITIIFDLAGTLVKMRPPKLLLKRNLLGKMAKFANLGIITGSKKTETKNIVKKLKIKEFLNFIISKDDSPYKKPNKQLFKLIPTKFVTRKMIYMGDTKKDFIFSKNIRRPFCYVGKRNYGIYQNEHINKVVNFIVKNFLK